MHEGVFITNNMAGRPPIRHIRVDCFGHQDCAESLAVLSEARKCGPNTTKYLSQGNTVDEPNEPGNCRLTNLNHVIL